MARIRRCLIALLLAICAPSAFAATNCPANSNGGAPYSCGDQGGAYAACSAAAASYTGAKSQACTDLVNTTATGRYTCTRSGSASGCDTAGAYYFFPVAATCLERPEQFTWQPSAQTVCYNGCTYHLYEDPDTGETFFSTFEEGSPTSGSVCKASDMPPPVVDTDGDGVPDEDDAFPNDPNESSDSDGDGIGDNADFAPNDPTDGSDAPGEEDGDDEGDNTASGGGDCKAPPSCQGDGIQCNQLFQQWQIRCSGATVTGDPTNCSAAYSCAGDSAQCAMVALSRKTACGVEGLGEGGQGGTQGDANGNGVADVLEGSGTGETGDPGEDVEPTRFGLGVSPDMLDQENIFGGGQCPEPPTFQIMGVSINGGNMPYWCTAMAILRACILIFGTFAAIKILTGWGFA